MLWWDKRIVPLHILLFTTNRGSSLVFRQTDMKYILSIYFIFFSFCSITPAMSEELPSWWNQLYNEAQKESYTLLALDDLKKLYESGEQFLIVDVRTDYEFDEGHLPGAVSFEFDLGDRLELKPEKKKAFQALLGPDKKRKVIFYCRSFR